MSRNGHNAPDTNSTADYCIATAEPPATVTKTLNPYSSKAVGIRGWDLFEIEQKTRMELGAGMAAVLKDVGRFRLRLGSFFICRSGPVFHIVRLEKDKFSYNARRFNQKRLPVLLPNCRADWPILSTNSTNDDNTFHCSHP